MVTGMKMHQNTKRFGRIRQCPFWVFIFSGCITFSFFSMVGMSRWSNVEYSKENGSSFSLEKPKYRRHAGNSSCIIVGCHSYGTAGVDYFWNYYSRTGFSLTLMSFDSMKMNNKRVHPTWCRMPAVLQEQKRNPRAKVLYIDIDTLADVNVWCNMPFLGGNAPIVMNSLFRSKAEATKDFTVHGTQVQANLFVTAPGQTGISAMKKWEKTFGNHALRDQGSIHLRETHLCGVPGWIHCFRNPEQQKCHCSTQFGGNSTAKSECIEKLFQGEKLGCGLTVLKSQ